MKVYGRRMGWLRGSLVEGKKGHSMVLEYEQS